MSEPRPTKVVWHDVVKVGFPPAALRNRNEVLNNPPRQFLVRNSYQMECAYVSQNGGRFETSEHFMDEVSAWAIIEGF